MKFPPRVEQYVTKILPKIRLHWEMRRAVGNCQTKVPKVQMCQKLTLSVFKSGSSWINLYRKDFGSLDRVVLVVMNTVPPTFNLIQSLLLVAELTEFWVGTFSFLSVEFVNEFAAMIFAPVSPRCPTQSLVDTCRTIFSYMVCIQSHINLHRRRIHLNVWPTKHTILLSITFSSIDKYNFRFWREFTRCEGALDSLVVVN